MPKKSPSLSPVPEGRLAAPSESPRGRPPAKRSQSPARRTASKPDAAALRAARAEITWFKRPISVVKLFLLCVWDLTLEYGAWTIKHPYTQKIVLPGAVAWCVAYQVEGAHHRHMQELTKTVEYIVWWIGLGILSSVGLGSGMHTGLLFLFPHIFKVTRAIENMKTLCPAVQGEFVIDPRENMWGRLPLNDPFKCHAGSVDSDDVVFLTIYWYCLPAAFLWGAGTAMGEIPPYWTAYAAKISGEVDEDAAEDITEVPTPLNKSCHLDTHLTVSTVI